MSRRSATLALATLSLALAGGVAALAWRASSVRPALAAGSDDSAFGTPTGANTSVAVLAGGCYWGMEYVFDHVRGVRQVTSGYAIPVTREGERLAGAAEAVRIEYDSSVVSYHRLLEIFFSVAHDPTQLNRQGPDVGANYRSIVFPRGDAQRELVRSYIDSLETARSHSRPIVTQVAALQSFHAAEPSEQRYAERHPHSPYIVINDVPKVKALKERFPESYR
jgi:peptide-methionine (S)-S-oxide reductase